MIRIATAQIALLHWSRCTFGNIHQRVHFAQRELTVVRAASPFENEREITLSCQLDALRNLEEEYWRQRSRA